MKRVFQVLWLGSLVGWLPGLVYAGPSALPEGISFELGAGSGRFDAWGRGRDTRWFFPEFLPALFERKLVLENANVAGGQLEWIFTGERGGFTVRIDTVEIGLLQQFYDSPGFNTVAGQTPRHPQGQTPLQSAKHDGVPHEVTVVLDHKLGLGIYADGRQVLHQECLFDVSRHQLRLTGQNDDNLRVAGQLVEPPVQTAQITVDAARIHQKMIGFGGITTPTAYVQLSSQGKQRWWELLCEYNLLIQREYPIGNRLNETMNNWDTLADATPHYYGDNFPNGEVSDFGYLRKLRSLGGKVWFEFWALPPRVGGDVNKYASAVVEYCRASRDKAGAPPDVVGVQNEVKQTVERWHTMTLALRQRLDEAGFGSVRIHMSDSGSLADGIERAEAFRRSQQVWNVIDYSASHMYDYQGFFTNPDGFDGRLRRWKEVAGDKPFLSTELCVNNSKYQWPTYRLALLMGQLYHKNLVVADAVAICYCWTLLNVVQPSYGWTRSLCVPDREHGFVPTASSHQLRVFGAYSRRIQEGMVRVASTSTDDDLLVCAFQGTGSAATIVLLNRGTASEQAKILWPGVAFSQLEIVDPYHQNEVRHLDGVSEVLVPPGAVVTVTNVPLRQFR
jgi:O-glycosyl hydrolase